MKTELTQEQKRIKIAEACGWGNITKLDSGWHGWKEQGPLEDLPDYLNDLNAMHEAEKVLNSGKINTYLGHLYRYAKGAKVGGAPWEIISARVAVHATAEQRAEAFGKTLGLW